MWYRLKKWARKRLDTSRGWFWYAGRRIYFPPGSIIYEIVHTNGSFESHVRDRMISLARDGSYVFDIGANIGLMAIPLLVRKPSIRIVSMEAGPNVFRYLQRTHDGIPENERWLLRNQAAADSVGELEFHECVGGKDALSGICDTRRGGESRCIRVPSVTVDSVWQELGCPDVSVMKIDVEGAELKVLQGASQCIRTVQPALIVEWWPPNFRAYGANASDLLKFACEAGYRVFSARYLSAMNDVCELSFHHAVGEEDFVLIPLVSDSQGMARV
mgnify:CR=1 FL=1